MTIGGWIVFALFAFVIISFTVSISVGERRKKKVALISCGVFVAVILLGAMLWYFNYTASGQRAMVDQRSNIKNGMERTITVYTADGKIIAQYTGKIDIEGNDGGYVLFDYDGKRYTYYNCFVESIAEIGG